MHANGQPIFQTTAVNEAYLSYHPRSVSKFTKKYKAWSYTKFTPNWNTSSSYSPPLLSPTTPTPVTNQNTYGYEKNPNIHQYTWQYIIVSIKYFSTRKFTGSNFSIWHTRNKSTYWLFSPSGHHYTGRSWNSHYPTATRPPPWYQCLRWSCQYIHYHESLHHFHNTTSIIYIWAYTLIPVLWIIYQYPHAPTVGSKTVNII